MALFGDPEEKRPFGKLRHRLEDNIKTDVRKMVLRSVEWIHVAHDENQCWPLLNAINLEVPRNA
jgi:hypothetical protein